MRMMFTITGPSCSGKTTLRESLIENYPETFVRLIADTTRPQRPGEISGEEYNFVTPEEFQQNRRNGAYVETINYLGVNYGSRLEDIQSAIDAGKVPIKVVEPQGVEHFSQVCADLGINLVAIYVNQDEHELVYRWLQRFRWDMSADMAVYSSRILETIKHEVRWVESPIYDYYFDLRDSSENEHLYTLSRIATGNIPLPMIRRISPNPHEKAT